MEEDDDDLDNTEEQGELLKHSIRKYEEMRERQEKYFFDVDALLKIIDHFIEQLDYEKAWEVVKYSRTLHPQSINVRLKEAHLLAMMGMEQEALKILESVEHVNPFDIDIHLIRGNIYNSLEQYERAIASFRKALELADEQKDDIYLSLAITYQNMGEYSKAVDYYKLCLLDNSSNEIAMQEMIISLELSHRLPEGITFFNRLIDEQPYHYLLWYNLGDLYNKTGQYESALSAFDYCLLIKEDFAPAHLDMAQAYAMLEKFHEAIACYKTAFEYCQPDEAIYYSIGECHENLKEYDTARTYYKKAVKIKPDMPQAWFGIGITFEEEERWYEAVHYIRKALELDEQNGEYWLALGDCEYRLNNFEEAEECYHKVVDFEPDNDEGWIAYADLLFEMNRPVEATEMINTALLYHSDHPEMRYRQVCYLYHSGRLQEAYSILSNALDHNPESYWIMYDIIPALEQDQRVQELIQLKGKRS